jgi:hypothetical protein
MEQVRHKGHTLHQLTCEIFKGHRESGKNRVEYQGLQLEEMIY